MKFDELIKDYLGKRDEKSFNKLYPEMKKYLEVFSYKYFGKVFEDSINGALTIMYYKIDMYDINVSKLQTWVWRVYVNDVLNSINNRRAIIKKHTRVYDISDKYESFNFELIDDNEIIHLLSNKLDRIIQDYIDMYDLDVKFKYMFFDMINGVEYAELSKKYDLELYKVKNRIYHIRNHITRAILKDRDFDESIVKELAEYRKGYNNIRTEKRYNHRRSKKEKKEYRMSIKQRIKISESCKGKKHSEETKRRISEGVRNFNKNLNEK